jgi:hypothetical protein
MMKLKDVLFGCKSKKMIWLIMTYYVAINYRSVFI